MKKFLKQYAPHIGASAIAITAVATAAVTPLPGSLPASVTTGGTILAADINAMIDSLNILDERTDGDAPVDDVDIVNKGYLDGEVATLNTAISNAGDDLGDHTATQNIDADGNLLTNLGAPTGNGDAANKEYVDNAVAAAGGSTVPDVTGLTGFGTIAQVNINGRDFAVMTNEQKSCSNLGSNWYNPTSFSANAYFGLVHQMPGGRPGGADDILNPSNASAAKLCAGAYGSYEIGLSTDYYTAGVSATKCIDAVNDSNRHRVCEYNENLNL